MISHRISARGYTVIELMMAITVFAIGVTGIAAMQKVTVASNSHAKTLALATHIAQSWQEQLAADSTLWAPGAPGATGTRWLATGVWTRPADVPAAGTATFGASFDPIGNFTTEAADIFFCAHIRITNMQAGVALPGNGMFRTEVRVFWPRSGRALTIPNYCAAGTDANGFTVNDTDEYHFVHMVSAVRQSTAVRPGTP
jgi:type IV pilus assembly protein PilV